MKRQGFTIIEFLIGMAMTVLIFIVATNMVVSFLSIDTKSKRSQALEEVKVDISRQLTDELTWGSTITHSANKLTVDKDTFEFELSGKRFLKNGVSLTPANVKVVSFAVTEFSDPLIPGAASYQVDIALEHGESANIKDIITVFSSPRVSIGK